LSGFTSCAAGASVDLYSIAGEGHEWPGSPPLPSAITRVLGPQSSAINANATMWSFFVAHPL
jgi:polyhydroxybutyrate depolymerase